MNFILKEGRKIVLVSFIIFVISYIFTDFSFYFLLVFLFFVFIFRNYERELEDYSDDVITSPADMTIIGIKADEDNNTIELICKKSIFSLNVLRAIVKSEKIECNLNKGLVFAGDNNAKYLSIKFNDKVTMCCINGFFTKNIIINKDIDLLKGNKFAFFLDGIIKIILPYDSRILVGLGDKVLANTKIAELGE